MSSLFIRSLGLVGLLLSTPAWPAAPQPAAPSNAAASTNGQPRADALALAQLLNPAEPLMMVAGRSFDQAFDQGISKEDAAALEKEHPGLIADLRKASREVMLADLRADMPALHRRYALFFGNRFTPSETAELAEFYRTPTGAKIIQAKFDNIDISGVIDKVAEDPDAKVSSADVEQINKGAIAGMFKGMTAADVSAMLAFGLRPVARKLKDAAPELAQIEAEIANEADPALDTAIEEATRKVYERYGLAQ